MQLYFEQWKAELGFSLGDADKAVFKRHGILAGYRNVFEILLKRQWRYCPADLRILASDSGQEQRSAFIVHLDIHA